MGQGPESAVRRGVAVAADDGHAGLGAALLGADHVDDAVADIAHGEELDPPPGDVLAKRLQLQPGFLVLHRVDAERLAFGGDVVVGDGERPVRAAHLAARVAKPREGLRRGHLVDQVQVDVEDRLLAVLADDVGVPDLVVQGLTGHAG